MYMINILKLAGLPVIPSANFRTGLPRVAWIGRSLGLVTGLAVTLACPPSIGQAPDNGEAPKPKGNLGSEVNLLNRQSAIPPAPPIKIKNPTANQPKSEGLGVVTLPQGDTIGAASFSPDGRLLAVGCGVPNEKGRILPGSVVLWDIPRHEELARFDAHKSSVTSVVFSPDGKTLATGGNDGAVILWDVKTRSQRSRIDQKLPRGKAPHFVPALAFSPDGRTLNWLFCKPPSLSLTSWNLATGREKSILRDEHLDVLALASDPSGHVLALVHGPSPDALGRQRSLYLCDVESERKIWRDFVPVSDGRVASMVVSPDGKSLACVYISPGGNSDDSKIVLRDAITNRVMATFPHFNSVAFSPNGRHLVIGGSISTAAPGEEPNRIMFPMQLRPLPEDEMEETLAKLLKRRPVLSLREIATGKEIMSLAGPKWGTRSVTFSPDGKTILLVRHKSVKLVEVDGNFAAEKGSEFFKCRLNNSDPFP